MNCTERRSDLAARLTLELAAVRRQSEADVSALIDQNLLLADLLRREMAARKAAEERFAAWRRVASAEEEEGAEPPPF